MKSFQTQEAIDSYDAYKSGVVSLTDDSPRTVGTVSEIVKGHIIARKMPSFCYMELILTGNCNLRCSYCWEKGKNNVDMKEETAFAAIDFLMEYSRDTKDISILFFGGEPFLKFKLMQKVWDYATEHAEKSGKKITWNMTTNGTLVNESIVKWCASHKVKYLLSIDGGREDHDRFRKFSDGRGSFDVIARKIPLMKKYQPWLGARMSITPESCVNLAKNIRDLHKIGINQFLLGYAHGIAWTSEALALYEKSLKEACEVYLEMKYKKQHFRMTIFEAGDIGKRRKIEGFGCGAGRGRLAVDPYGDIYGCSKMANITGMGNGVIPIGNVFQGLIKTDARKLLLDKSIKARKKCQNCEFKNRCSGGCPAINYESTGCIFHPGDLSCKIVFIEERVNDYMQQRYKEVFGKSIDQ